MSDFKVGDKVRVTERVVSASEYHAMIGKVGEVVTVYDGNHPYIVRVRFAAGDDVHPGFSGRGALFDAHEVEKVEG